MGGVRTEPFSTSPHDRTHQPIYAIQFAGIAGHHYDELEGLKRHQLFKE
jgi:hypothetical protein